MYVPAHFREDDLGTILAFIADARLATLVSHGPSGFIASHVPMHYDPAPQPYGTLRAHVARANQQWRDLNVAPAVLAIFLGPDAYVTPSAYETKREHGKVVPTWNYAAVHALGDARISEDPAELHALVRTLTDRREGSRPEPWHVSDAPDPYIASQLRAIVGITIPVTRFEAKWKMSQNRSDADVLGVVNDLRASDEPVERVVAEVMAERLARRDGDRER